MNKQIRQGDVFLDQGVSGVDLSQYEEIQTGKVTLAHGEATGHAHVVTGDEVTLLERDNRRLLWVEAPASLDHLTGSGAQTGEHDSIVIAPGMYWVVGQREYTPTEIRRVQD